MLACSAAFATGAMKTLDKPVPITGFTLTDQYDNPFGIDNLKGKWSMIFIGFTSCPDVCPTVLANLEAVRADMGLRMRPDTVPNIIFLAVDPHRDRAALKEYLKYFHPDYIGITGVTREIDHLTKNLGAFYRIDKRSAEDQNYSVTHSSTVYLINPDAALVATINPPFHPHQTGEFLIQLIRR